MLTALAAAAAFGEIKLTQQDLLEQVIDLNRLTRPAPGDARNLLFSSFDRSQFRVEGRKFVNWDANNDRGQFLRQTDDGWDVLVDLRQPAYITRIWCAPPAGEVRLVVDGDTVLTGPLLSVFDGSHDWFGAPLAEVVGDQRAAVCYTPISCARELRIETRGFDGAYQVDCVALPPEAEVESFSLDIAPEMRETLRRVAHRLQHSFDEAAVLADHRTLTVALQDDLKPGAMLKDELTGPGTVRALYVATTDRVEPRTLYALHKMVIRLYWDGAPTPAVEAPLADFFGSGFERNLYNALVMGTNRWTEMPGEFPPESWFMYCMFPMPFKDGMRIEIVNEGDQKIGVMAFLRVERSEPPPDSLRFRARYVKEDPCEAFDLPLLATEGAGRLVGCVLNVDTPRRAWWGEGDHKLWIDGSATPNILGTDTPGFFGNAQPLVAHAWPFSGATLVNDVGKNSLYRWMLNDSVAYHDGLQFSIENWQVDKRQDVFYAAVVYWYGEPGAKSEHQPLEAADLAVPGLRIPGAIEIEGTIGGEDWGTVMKQKYAGGVELSGGNAVRINASDPVTITLDAGERVGPHQLRLRVHPKRSFTTIEVRDVEGERVGMLEYNREQPDGIYDVGAIELAGQPLELTVTCERAAVLDCWIVAPLESTESATAAESPATKPSE